MEGNQAIKKFERNLIKYDKSKYNFTKYSSETFLVLHKNKIVIEEYYDNYTENEGENGGENGLEYLKDEVKEMLDENGEEYEDPNNENENLQN